MCAVCRMFKKTCIKLHLVEIDPKCWISRDFSKINFSYYYDLVGETALILRKQNLESESDAKEEREEERVNAMCKMRHFLIQRARAEQ